MALRGLSLLLTLTSLALYPLAERYMTVARTLAGWRYQLGDWPPPLSSAVLALLLTASLFWALPRLGRRLEAAVVSGAALAWLGLCYWVPETTPAQWLQPWWQLALLLVWLSWLPLRQWARQLSLRLLGRLRP